MSMTTKILIVEDDADSAEFLRLKKTCRELIRTESIKAFEEQEHAAV